MRKKINKYLAKHKKIGFRFLWLWRIVEHKSFYLNMNCCMVSESVCREKDAEINRLRKELETYKKLLDMSTQTNRNLNR